MVKAFLSMMVLISTTLITAMDSTGSSPNTLSCLSSSLSKSLELVSWSRAQELIEEAKMEGYKIGLQERKRDLDLLSRHNKLLQEIQKIQAEQDERLCERLETMQEQYEKLKFETKKIYEDLRFILNQPRQPLTESQLAKIKNAHVHDLAYAGKLPDILNDLEKLTK